MNTLKTLNYANNSVHSTSIIINFLFQLQIAVIYYTLV